MTEQEVYAAALERCRALAHVKSAPCLKCIAAVRVEADASTRKDRDHNG